MSYGKSDLFDIAVELVHQTDKAWLVNDGTLCADDNKPVNVWVPKSQCELERNSDGKTWTLTGPEWLLNAKGLT